MNEKYSLKIIQQGKTQQVRIVQNGAGMAGEAVVIQATDATRFQLVNAVTLASPTKLQLKRVGNALHVVLPGGDIDAPDLVIQDYFKVTGASLQGSAISGEWMSYDTSSLVANSATSSVVDKTATVTLSGGSMVGNFTEHPWLWAGGIVGVAAASGGGGGSAAVADTTPLSAIKAYAGGGTTTAPTVDQYTEVGLTLPSVAGVTAANVLGAMNAVVASKTSSDVATLAQLQTLAERMRDAYIKILAEANGTTADATPGADPTVTDYASVGITIGSTAQTLTLVNSAVGELSTTGVDSVVKLTALALAAQDLMKVAAGTATAGLLTNTDLLALGLKINGANSGITTVLATALQTNLANLETSLGLSETFSDGTAVNTIAKVQALLSLQAMRSFNDDTAAIGSKTSPAPGTVDYTNIGIKAYASLADTLIADRIALSDTNFSTVAGFSLQSTLNSALDKLATGTALTKTMIQSMVDSYYRILKEADGSTTTNTDVYADITNDATNAAAYNDPTATDYANIGVTKVDGTALTVTSTTNTEILALLNDTVGRFDTTRVDTATEISALEKAAENIIAVGAGTGNGSATTGVSYTTDAEWVAGFTALGVTGVTTANLAAVKKAIDTADSANNGQTIDTVQELLDLVKPVIALQVLVDYTNTNTNGTSTAPTLSTYTDAGIKAFASLTDTLGADRVALSASNADINALNSAVDKLAGSSLTLNSSTSLFDGTVQKMVDSYYRILKEADGRYIGDANGGAAYYDNSTLAKTANTDVYADTINDATNAAAYNDPTAADYANIGVTKVDGTALTVASTTNTEILALLNDAVGRFDTTHVDTAAEISAMEKAAENVFALSSGGALGSLSYTGATADADWVAGLTALGVTGVTASNITAIKTAIDAKDAANDGTAVDTMSELQAVVSLARMAAFTNDAANIGSKTADTPTLADWGALVNVNTSLTDATTINLNAATYWKTSNPTNGLNALNSALDTYTGASLTPTLLTTIANSYGRVLQEADGSRTLNTDVSKVDNSANADLTVADLTSLGVSFLNTSGTATTLLSEQRLVFDAIGGLTSTAVDSLSELNDLAKAADNVVKQAAGGTGINTVTYQDSEWVSALSSLGITGANTNNITAIKSAIAATADDGTAVDSYNELQSIVSMVRIADYAALHTGYTLPTLEDYQALVATQGTATDVSTYGLTAISTTNAGGAFVGYSAATSANLSAYNDAVNVKPSGAFTDSEVKSMVLAYNSILSEANGSTADQTAYDPLAADYLAVGVGTGTPIDANITAMLNVTEYATLLTDVVANKTTTQVDQVSELNALASILVKIQDLETKTATGGANYTAITGGALQVSELATLGLDTSNLTNGSFGTTVLSNRLNSVYDGIIAIDHNSSVSRATLDSLFEMQQLINNTNSIIS